MHVERGRRRWTRWATDLVGDPAATSFRIGTRRHERVLFARSQGGTTVLRVLRFAEGAALRTIELPVPAGLALRDASFALSAWTSGSSALLHAAAATGDGRLCLWWWWDDAAASAPLCTGSGWLDPSREAAVAAGSTQRALPFFYYRRYDGVLVRTSVRFRWGAPPVLHHEELGRPPGSWGGVLATPLTVVPGDPDRVFVVTLLGELFEADVPAASGASPTWHRLPVTPGQPLDVEHATALRALRWGMWSGGWFGQPFTWTEWLTVFAADRLGGVVRYSSGAGPDSSRWRLERRLRPSGSMRWLGGGAPGLDGPVGLALPVLWGVLGGEPAYPGVPGASSLARLRGSYFEDYLFPVSGPTPAAVLGRPPDAPPTPSSAYLPATEGNVSLGSVGGLAAAIHREHPWRVLLSWTGDGGLSFSPTIELPVSRGWRDTVSASDPFVAYDPYEGVYHLTVLEVRTSGSQLSCRITSAPQGEPRMVVVYRRARSLEALRAADWAVQRDPVSGAPRAHFDCSPDAQGTAACVLGAPDADAMRPALTESADHEVLLLTRSAAGTTAHVFFQHGGPVYHWWRGPDGVDHLVPVRASASGATVSGPPTGFTDAAQHIYLASVDVDLSGPDPTVAWPRICRISPATGRCEGEALRIQFVAEDGTPVAPPPLRPWDVRFDERKQFQTTESVAYAAHPRVPGRLYAVFQGRPAPGSSARGMQVYLTQHDPEKPVHVWTPPVPLLPSGEPARVYFDPEVTVDERGAVTVTFSGGRVTAASGRDEVPTLLDEPVARFIARSPEGRAFRVERLPPSRDWRPEALPVHCSRGKHFLGEYRRPASLGPRALHLLPVSGPLAPFHLAGRFVGALPP